MPICYTYLLGKEQEASYHMNSGQTPHLDALMVLSTARSRGSLAGSVIADALFYLTDLL